MASFIGNSFSITLRSLHKSEVNSVLKNYAEVKEYGLPNYFDEQRFGAKKNNHLIGKAIVKKDFKKAVELIDSSFEGTDFVGFLRKIPKKVLMIYVHSYQSFLYNLIVEKYLQCKYINFVVI